jgi:alpha-glucosidase
VATWEHLWIANIQVQRMSISGMGFTGSDIGGFAEQPSGELYALDSIGCFHPFEEHIRLVIMEIRSLGHLMSRLLILPESLLIFATSCCHTCIPCFGNILKRVPMLKPLVYYDQSDIQTHYRNDEFVLEIKF